MNQEHERVLLRRIEIRRICRGCHSRRTCRTSSSGLRLAKRQRRDLFVHARQPLHRRFRRGHAVSSPGCIGDVPAEGDRASGAHGDVHEERRVRTDVAGIELFRGAVERLLPKRDVFLSLPPTMSDVPSGIQSARAIPRSMGCVRFFACPPPAGATAAPCSGTQSDRPSRSRPGTFHPD